MKKFLFGLVMMFASISVFADGSYDDYTKEVAAYDKCVEVNKNFSGGSPCIEPDSDYFELSFLNDSVYKTPLGIKTEKVCSIYIDGQLFMNDVVVLIDGKRINLSHVKMVLEDGSFYIEEISE